MKRAGSWLLSALALIAATTVGLFVLSPGARVVMSVLIAPLFNYSTPPPIAEGVITKEDWQHFETASRKLTIALQSKFTVNSKAEILKSSLLGQGFKFMKHSPSNCTPLGQHEPAGAIFYRCLTAEQEEQRGRTLVYEWGGGICISSIYVIWSSNEVDALTHVEGRYHGACL